MLRENIYLVTFILIAVGLPLWAMQANKYDKASVHRCTGQCYENWKQETGGIVAVSAAQTEARAAASPQVLGQAAYAGCIACHGSRGEGGWGPAIFGQSATSIYEKLLQYKNGETRGPQSSLMWSQAKMLNDVDMNNLAIFIESLSDQ